MKKILCVLLALSVIFSFAACSDSGKAADSASEGSASLPEQSSEPEQSSLPGQSSEPEQASSEESSAAESVPEEAVATKTLVVYFSCTGTTEAVAEKIAVLAGADLYEIVPEQEYTAADLNYSNSGCRANLEMNDPDARPAISGSIPDISEYSTVYIGYPIWWGTMPRIINTFIESCDLSGKVIMPFCTSGGSGVSTSVSDIRAAAPDADVRDGLRANGADDTALSEWMDGAKQ